MGSPRRDEPVPGRRAWRQRNTANPRLLPSALFRRRTGSRPGPGAGGVREMAAANWRCGRMGYGGLDATATTCRTAGARPHRVRGGIPRRCAIGAAVSCADRVLPRCCRGAIRSDQEGPEAVHPRRGAPGMQGAGVPATANARRTTGTSVQSCPGESPGPVVHHRGGRRRTGKNVLRSFVAEACNQRPGRKPGNWKRAAANHCRGRDEYAYWNAVADAHRTTSADGAPLGSCEVETLAGVARHHSQERRP